MLSGSVEGQNLSGWPPFCSVNTQFNFFYLRSINIYTSNFSTNKPTFKTTKCGTSCFCCDYIVVAELFKSKNWHQPFVLKSNFNFKTSNLIYVIICSSCNKEYIGQTRGQLKERLSIYRQHI